MKDGHTSTGVAAALAGYDAARDAYHDLQARLEAGEDPLIIVDAVDQVAADVADLPQASDLTALDPPIAASLAARAQAAGDACRAVQVALEEIRQHHSASAQQEARQAKAVRGYLHETRPGEARYLDTEG